jgi:diguanylate cyclase (GGDEF)-like protein
MLDLDHFKSVNDVHGHLAGDEVLRRCAELVRSGLRSTDIAGRFGGEEICLILPQCRLESAVVIAERIRQELEVLQIPYREKFLQVTVSGGVSAVDVTTTSGDELIEAADQALYEAKRTGRNRICAAGTSRTPTNRVATHG